MHDDLCMAHATSKAVKGRRLNCWLAPGHIGDHWDADMAVWWTHAPSGVREPRRRLPFLPRPKAAL